MKIRYLIFFNFNWIPLILAFRVHKSSTFFRLLLYTKQLKFSNLVDMLDLIWLSSSSTFNLKKTIMRSNSTFSVLFWLYSSRSKNGKAPIYARISVNGKKLNISLKRRIQIQTKSHSQRRFFTILVKWKLYLESGF